MSTRRTVAATLLATVAMLTATLAGGRVAASEPTPAEATTADPVATSGVTGFIRVDQLGYAPNETKIAYLLATSPVGGAPFRVVDAIGHTVLTGHAGRTRGAWNETYGAVHPLDMTNLHATGTYRILVNGAVTASSPPFRVAPRAELFGPRVNDTVAFFQAQRDGANVIPDRSIESHPTSTIARPSSTTGQPTRAPTAT